MTGRWPPADLFGLHVDLGDYHTVRAVWLRLPTAVCSQPWRHVNAAVGAADVADLTTRLDAIHARNCPGPTPKERTA